MARPMFEHAEGGTDLYRPTRSGVLARWRTHYRVAKLVGGGGKVLDVGCGPGYLAEELKKKNNYVVGIEVDEASAAAAKAICDEVKVADLEGLAELPYAAGFFDVIVFSDVLEHLARPDLALARLGHYLAPEGKIVAAIPNVAWAPVRLGLLFGRFDYQEKGHLDKGHLRFFTLRTVKQLFVTSGYKIVTLDYVGLPIPATLLAMKFLIVAKRADPVLVRP